MKGRRRLAPLVVVAATDLALVVILAGPWTVGWSSHDIHTPGGALSQMAAALRLPGFVAADQWTDLGLYLDRWRAGTYTRVGVFLAAHLWVAAFFVRQAGSEGRWRAARAGAWVLGPLVGAIAGLATVAPASFDLSTTVEERADLRTAGLLSLGDGAYWGLVAGGLCWITLTVARMISRVATRSSTPQPTRRRRSPFARYAGCSPTR